MSKISKSITDLIGHTHLLALNQLSKKYHIDAQIVAKLESFNPGRSVKDRLGFALIDVAEKQGWIDKKTVIIEPTSGNTEIALAYIASAKGYRLVLVMPDSMSIERRNILQALGAEVVLSPGYEGMGGAIRKAVELKNSFPKAFISQQFNNPANPAIQIAKRPENSGKQIVVVLPDTGERYLSTALYQYDKENEAAKTNPDGIEVI